MPANGAELYRGMPKRNGDANADSDQLMAVRSRRAPERQSAGSRPRSWREFGRW